MPTRRRALIGYRYGRMCLRAEAAGKRMAIRLTLILAAGMALGIGAALAWQHYAKPQSIADCILDHVRGSGSREATFLIRDACQAKYLASQHP
jgi:hypothetical protein